VVIEAASDPASGSDANEPINSQVAIRGRWRRFGSSVASVTVACDPMPLLVPKADRNAVEHRPGSGGTSTSSFIERPGPPDSTPIVIPKSPSPSSRRRSVGEAVFLGDPGLPRGQALVDAAPDRREEIGEGVGVQRHGFLLPGRPPVAETLPHRDRSHP
jgi:hypothetical protein